MAKKRSTPRTNARIKARDKVTLGKIVDLADGVAGSAFKKRDIRLDIPTRTRSNTIWNKRRGILEMGDATAERELFNLNQAKQFMQTMLHASTIKDLIAAEKSSSLRSVFYKAKHTVAGTKENTFDTQDGRSETSHLGCSSFTKCKAQSPAFLAESMASCFVRCGYSFMSNFANFVCFKVSSACS